MQVQAPSQEMQEVLQEKVSLFFLLKQKVLQMQLPLMQQEVSLQILQELSLKILLVVSLQILEEVQEA